MPGRRPIAAVVTAMVLSVAAVALPAAAQEPGVGPGAFAAAGTLGVARVGHSATLLPDDRVLVAGGADLGAATYLASVETWDPVAAAFTPAGDLAASRGGHTATLLPDGRVLLVGGGTGEMAPNQLVADAEVWDPATATSEPAGTLDRPRTLQTATLLADGRVVIVGGFDASDGSIVTRSRIEIWDPATGAFSSAGALGQARYSHTATMLADGRVLIAGGVTQDGDDYQLLATTEIWDPASMTTSVGPTMVEGHGNHTTTLLADGRILVIGGLRSQTEFAGAEILDPVTGTFASTGEPGARRVFHSATQVPDGRVLVIGGRDATATTGTTELWNRIAGTFGAAASLSTMRDFHSATLLADGRVLVVGGVPEAEVWAP